MAIMFIEPYPDFVSSSNSTLHSFNDSAPLSISLLPTLGMVYLTEQTLIRAEIHVDAETDLGSRQKDLQLDPLGSEPPALDVRVLPILL